MAEHCIIYHKDPLGTCVHINENNTPESFLLSFIVTVYSKGQWDLTH